ncbi:hypothetical protein DS831_04605 [Bombilactobacillus bombi]|uniref:Uncharacterized protein n=1 Tax=Bombilactobacillus bombi TaxID=1303590 RepID=A0A417ZIA4_9LACO|nr:hypothetical protein [Bombilactobacillus bombi]RHW51305.1 hypothetical protein DS831_04605 [Bombilactobacillus bombi]
MLKRLFCRHEYKLLRILKPLITPEVLPNGDVLKAQYEIMCRKCGKYRSVDKHEWFLIDSRQKIKEV